VEEEGVERDDEAGPGDEQEVDAHTLPSKRITVWTCIYACVHA